MVCYIFLKNLNKISVILICLAVFSLKSDELPEYYQKLNTRKELTEKLFNAVEYGQPEFIRSLIRSGADVNAHDKQGNTPLHKAAREGNASIAQELLIGGAHSSIKDSKGNTALDIASNEYQKLIDTDENRVFKRLLKRLPAKKETIETYLKEQKLEQFRRTLSVLFNASEQ